MSTSYIHIISISGKSSKVLSYDEVTAARSTTSVSHPDSGTSPDGTGEVMEAWASVKKAVNDKVEGRLYTSLVSGSTPSGQLKVSWIMDTNARTEKTVNKVVGYASVHSGKPNLPDPKPKVAPISSADGSSLGGRKAALILPDLIGIVKAAERVPKECGNIGYD